MRCWISPSASPINWTLIGGQMVLLRAVEHGRVPPRVTRDLDVLADLRACPPQKRPCQPEAHGRREAE
jgi:hypothetical protein